MKTNNEYAIAVPPTGEQLLHREQLSEYAEKKRQKELRNALVFKLGTLLSSCWSCVEDLLRIPRKEVDTEAAFALLKEFLQQVANSEQYTIFDELITSKATTSPGDITAPGKNV